MKRNFINKLSGGVFLGLFASTSIVSAALPEPCAPGGPLKAPVADLSDLTVKVELVGTMPTVGGPNNLASPVTYKKNEMFLIDQAYGNLYSYCTSNKVSKCKNGTRLNQIFYTIDVPPSLGDPGGNRETEAIINVAGNHAKNKVYIAFTATLRPAGVPIYDLPFPDEPSGGREDFIYIDGNPDTWYNSNNGSGALLDRDIYRIDAPDFAIFWSPVPMRDQYQVIYEYDYIDGVLSNPEAIIAFGNQGGPNHAGGAMSLTPNGHILYTTGDNLPFGTDGRKAPQDDSTIVSKLLIIDPDTASVTVAAKGLRNVQHMQKTSNPAGIIFADIGGVTAEEVNFISWEDLLDTSEIENFGWGNPDPSDPNGGREGTYKITAGLPLVLGVAPAACMEADQPEAGYRQPLAQYGRSFFHTFSFVAASGPVVSKKSFKDITMIYGDLPSGELYGTTAKIDGRDEELFALNIVDEDLNPMPKGLSELVLGGRVDPRFFLFPDGTAGVLLEATGDFYRLTEVD